MKHALAVAWLAARRLNPNQTFATDSLPNRNSIQLALPVPGRSNRVAFFAIIAKNTRSVTRGFEVERSFSQVLWAFPKNCP